MIEDAWEVQSKYPMSRDEFREIVFDVAEEFRGKDPVYVREQTAHKLARLTGEHPQDILNKIFNWIR